MTTGKKRINEIASDEARRAAYKRSHSKKYINSFCSSCPTLAEPQIRYTRYVNVARKMQVFVSIDSVAADTLPPWLMINLIEVECGSMRPYIAPVNEQFAVLMGNSCV